MFSKMIMDQMRPNQLRRTTILKEKKHTHSFTHPNRIQNAYMYYVIIILNYIYCVTLSKF
jgi:hypothetical protein